MELFQRKQNCPYLDCGMSKGGQMMDKINYIYPKHFFFHFFIVLFKFCFVVPSVIVCCTGSTFERCKTGTRVYPALNFVKVLV